MLLVIMACFASSYFAVVLCDADSSVAALAGDLTSRASHSDRTATNHRPADRCCGAPGQEASERDCESLDSSTGLLEP